MVANDAVKALSALAQHTRLDVFRLLVRQGASGLKAGDISQELQIPPPTLSFHLKELRHAGLLACRRNGRSLIYSADYVRVNELIGYLLENCCERDCEASEALPT